MIRQILVPLDGSALAETVVPCAREFARLLGASVIMLRVIEPVMESRVALPGFDLPDERVPLEAFDLDAARAQAQTYLAAVVGQFRHAGVEAYARVAVGQPATVISEAAAQCDVVAMTTHGRSGIGRLAFGSVADAIVRRGPAPVLLVRADQTDIVATGHPRRILVPLDGSDLAEQALPLATEIAERAGATLLLLRSLTWPDDVATGFAYLDPISGADLIERDEAQARAELTAVGARLTRQGLSVSTIFDHLPAAEAIVASAADQRADLIVMSTHGRGGLARWALGSVADRVVHRASVPVLLVRAEAATRSLAVDDRVASTPARSAFVGSTPHTGTEQHQLEGAVWPGLGRDEVRP